MFPYSYSTTGHLLNLHQRRLLNWNCKFPDLLTFKSLRRPADQDLVHEEVYTDPNPPQQQQQQTGFVLRKTYSWNWSGCYCQAASWFVDAHHPAVTLRTSALISPREVAGSTLWHWWSHCGIYAAFQGNRFHVMMEGVRIGALVWLVSVRVYA